MSGERQDSEKKSLRLFTRRNPDWVELAKDCVCFANAQGGRLLNERSAQPWETLTGLGVPRDRVDPEKLASFGRGIRASDRVKSSVKEKTDQELLDHYLLADGGVLTHLGVLCVGSRLDRARLGTAPVVQFLKYDEAGRKVNKMGGCSTRK